MDSRAIELLEHIRFSLMVISTILGLIAGMMLRGEPMNSHTIEVLEAIRDNLETLIGLAGFAMGWHLVTVIMRRDKGGP